jgi:hypothetical protein
MLPPSEKLRIIVGGMVGQFPLGGVAWDYLNYVLGFHELGHDVYYDENTNAWPYHPIKQEHGNDAAFSASFIDAFFVRFCPELRTHWHFNLLMKESFGLTGEKFDDVARSADVYLNVSGACSLPENLNPRCKKVFLDTDPGLHQISLHKLIQAKGKRAERYQTVANHDVFLTYAQNIHSADCPVPKLGFEWITSRPVVSLPFWDWCRSVKPKDEAFTTVMNLNFLAPGLSLNGIEYQGKKYHDKSAAFEEFIDLPARTKATLRPAIGGIRQFELDRILEKGWHVQPAYPISDTPERFQEFIADSYAEWSIAKNVYAEAKTGWFSPRTCCYLAAGRPAVVQDTSWSRYLPSGEGLIAFTTLDSAAAGLEAVMSAFPKHQQAAYEIANDFLAPSAVLIPALESIMNC